MFKDDREPLQCLCHHYYHLCLISSLLNTFFHQSCRHKFWVILDKFSIGLIHPSEGARTNFDQLNHVFATNECDHFDSSIGASDQSVRLVSMSVRYKLPIGERNKNLPKLYNMSNTTEKSPPNMAEGKEKTGAAVITHTPNISIDDVFVSKQLQSTKCSELLQSMCLTAVVWFCVKGVCVHCGFFLLFLFSFANGHDSIILL